MINATKPYLPSREAFQKYMDGIWESGWLTNNGTLVRELSSKMGDYLGVDNLLLVTNGTIALQIAIKAMDLQGEIITTPFSYVATTSSIVWEGCKPVFADIDPTTLNIDPAEIENKITARTSAIMATHVFGIPCEVEAIQSIADRHGIPVIYDAAHAFGINYKGKCILEYGDISTLSLHATKLFHTVEGGAIFCNEKKWFDRVEYMRRFGHDTAYSFHGLGINGKLSEVHAAMGLCILPDIEEITKQRKSICDQYDELLDGCGIERPVVPAETTYNYAYYPVIFPSEEKLLRVITALEQDNVNGRRYFSPSLNTLDYVDSEAMPVSEDISSRIFCLPLFHDLAEQDVQRIGRIVASCE